METPTPTPTPTPSPTPSPTPEPAPSSSSLGAGAIAGIAIGGVAVLALIIFLIWFVRRRKQKDATRTTPYTNVAREEPSPPMQDRHTVTSTFSDSTTAYALPSPRTDPWKQSWQSYSDQDAGYSARFSTTNGSEVPRSTTGVPGSPAELVTLLLPNELLYCLLTWCTAARFRFTHIAERIGWVSTITNFHFLLVDETYAQGVERYLWQHHKSCIEWKMVCRRKPCNLSLINDTRGILQEFTLSYENSTVQSKIFIFCTSTYTMTYTSHFKLLKRPNRLADHRCTPA